jgi:hypothetical protein
LIKKVTDAIGLLSLMAGAYLIWCLMGFSSGQTPEEKPRLVKRPIPIISDNKVTVSSVTPLFFLA